jgi:enoyl-[acyl-carrier protein] reductase I
MTSQARSLGIEGKNVVVLGVADESSIAWGIASAFLAHGAKVHIGYQQKFLSRVRQLIAQNPGLESGRCDVLKADEMTAFFERFRDAPIDVLVHAIAYGPPEVFTSDPSGVGAEAFAQMLSISAHSLLGVVRYAKPYLREWASVLTLTFQASERAEPFYGLMGVAKSALESAVRYLAVELGQKRVRVNAISPGPIETLAAIGIVQAFIQDPTILARQRGEVVRLAIARARAEAEAAGYDDVTLATSTWRHLQSAHASHCALEELIAKEDVADCALFLGSDLSRKITGQVIHVDGGLSSSAIM